MQQSDDGPAPSTRPKRGPNRAVRMDAITKRPIDWLWKPYLQRRAINVLTGDPGVGKSTLVCEIVSALSRGRPLPGDAPGLLRTPINCWFMNGEDAADDTIKWRMENQGADPERVFITDKRETITSIVAWQIGEECARLGVGLLIIDPLQAWMGKDVDMNKANETRDWGSYLREAAMRHDFAVLLCRHRRKGQPGDNKLYSGIGSIDITGIARSEIAAIRDKNDNRYIERIKGTVGKTGGALGYEIDDNPDPLNDHGIFRWLGPVAPGQAASPRPSTTPKAQALAAEWLAGRLLGGPVPAQLILEEAKTRGISERTLQRAKTQAGVKSEKLSDGNWVWMLAV